MKIDLNFAITFLSKGIYIYISRSFLYAILCDQKVLLSNLLILTMSKAYIIEFVQPFSITLEVYTVTFLKNLKTGIKCGYLRFLMYKMILFIYFFQDVEETTVGIHLPVAIISNISVNYNFIKHINNISSNEPTQFFKIKNFNKDTFSGEW